MFEAQFLKLFQEVYNALFDGINVKHADFFNKNVFTQFF